MAENKNQSLIRRPASSVEKAAPGAKRILSGMIADTLALARVGQSDKVVCTVLIGDDTDGIIPVWFESLLPHMEGFERFNFRPINFKSASRLRTATQNQPFDLIVINFTRVRWDVSKQDGDAIDDVVRFLGHLKSTHNKPIIVFSTYELTHPYAGRFAQTGVNYFPMPLSLDEMKPALQVLHASLKSSLNFKEKLIESTAHPRKARPLRIVVVNDEEGPIQSIKIVLQKRYNKDAEVLTFDDSEKAWQELLRTDPDLLITDDIMPALGGMEIVRRLTDKKAAYPVILTTAFERAELLMCVRDCASRGLKIKLLNCPWPVESFLKAVEDSLKIQRSTFEKTVETVPQPYRTRPPRIVILDDEEGPRQWHLAVLKGMCEGQTILDFESSDAAWQELSRQDPDLFITDIAHPGMPIREMLTRLAERKITYPIIIVSAREYDDEVVKSWEPRLKITFFLKPVDLKRYRTAVEAALQIPARRNHEK